MTHSNSRTTAARGGKPSGESKTRSGFTSLKELFLLDPSVTFLNFGSFGACPAPVFDDYIRWQRLLEFESVQFIAMNGPEYMKQAREDLGAYIGCDANDLVYTPNPTFAGNIIAKNLNLEPGDEVLSTDLEYGAMDRTWKYFCGKADARYIRQPIRFPVHTKEEFLEQFWNGCTSKTRVVCVSHITSATALILPVKEICAEAKRRGLIMIVDGAHTPGHIPLNIRELQADFYVGACHKWMMTPKGSSFLFAKKEFQESLEPLVVSWGYQAEKPSASRFLDYHQFNGTRDFSAYLTTRAAINFMDEHNWSAVAERCRQLVRTQAPRFCELTGMHAVSPITDEWLGQMFSIPIRTREPEKLQQYLFDEHRIEIPVTKRDMEFYIRYSIQAFNDEADLEKLYKGIEGAMQLGLISK